MEMGPPPPLASGIAADTNPPSTNDDEASPLPGGFIPGVSHLYGPITRTDLALGGTGAAGGPTFVTPIIDGNSVGPVTDVAPAPVPESSSTSLFLVLSAVAILAARKSFLVRIARR